MSFLHDNSHEMDGAGSGQYVVSVRDLTAPQASDGPWSVVLVDDANIAFQAVNGQAILVIGASLLAGLVLSLLVQYGLRHALRPYEQVTALAAKWRDSDLSATTMGNSALAQSITGMAERIKSMSTEVDQRRQRLRDDLDMAARVSEESLQHDSIDSLFERVLTMICSEARFHYAQIFLVDELGENAFLAQSVGSGDELVDKSRLIPIDERSVLGRVLSRGRAEVDNNLQVQALVTPGLVAPRSRSRLVLALLSGESVLGALDIQSNELDTFMDEEIQSFELLANQVSTAMHGIQLLQESQERAEQINMLTRVQTRADWQAADEKLEYGHAYHYDLREVKPGEAAQADVGTVSVPITIRGEVVGSLDVASPESGSLTHDEQLILQAVTDRVALAIDRARLFQETQLSLQETSLLYDLSRRINEATELEQIIAALIELVMPDAIRGQIMEFDEYPEDGTPEILRVRSDWADEAVGMRGPYLRGLRFRLADYSFFDSLHSAEVRLVEDVSSVGLSEDLARLMTGMGAQALAVVPLVMRSTWRGLILIEFPVVRRFSQQERRVYTALIDQAGVAIDNSLLMRQTEETLNEISRLYAASSAISSAPDLDMVYQAAALHLSTAISSPMRIMIMLAEPERALDAPLLEYAYAWDGAVDYSMMHRQVQASENPYALLVRSVGAALVHLPDDLRDQPGLMAALQAENVQTVIVTPLLSRQRWFGLLACTSPEANVFDDQYRRFVQTVADQVAIAVENHDLIRATESERETLSSILATMPAGVLVLEAQTFLPLHVNDQIEQLLGQSVKLDVAFSSSQYNLYRTGTELHYPDEDLPITLCTQIGDLAFADDVVVQQPDQSQIDLLVNAAPIHNSDGAVVMIVATFENISSLRGLENALQDNLRETISLYEATRALAEADQVEHVLDVLVMQLALTDPDDAFVVLLDETGENRTVVRSLYGDLETVELPDVLFDPREALRVDDVTTASSLDKEIQHLLAKEDIGAFNSIPLRARARSLPLAWLMTVYKSPQHFTLEDERYMNTLADSAATALDNRYLFQSTERALEEASILYQASRAITAAGQPADILQALTSYLLHEDVHHIFIALLQDRDWQLPGVGVEVVANWSGDDSAVNLEGMVFSQDTFPAWKQLSTPDLLVISDTSTAEDLDGATLINLESLSTRSLVIMPLRVGARAIGAIWMGAKKPHSYSEQDLRIYQAFAEQTSIAINANQLYDQAERRAGQLQISAQVSQAASSILDLDMLLPRMVDLIKDAFRYDHVQVFLMDRDDRFAMLRASTGEAGRQLLSIGHKLEKGSASVIGQVTAKNGPIVASDTGSSDVVHKPNPHLPHTRSEIALPLNVKGQVVGALDVQSNRPNAFNEEDVAVLTTLAAQISVAIDNARLFEQAEHRANDMSLLFAVTTAAAAADNLTDALENVASDLRESLDALAVGIFLPVQYIDEVAGDMRTTMRVAAIAGYEQPLREIEEVEVGDMSNLIGLSAQTLRAQIINSVPKQPKYLALSPEAQSAVVVPLSSAGQIVGMVLMENQQAFAYNHETLTLLQTMGGTLTALIQNQQLLERLQETNEQLLEIDRVKSEFLANMSHELRTPLNSIIGFSRVILKGIDGPLTEMQEQDLSTIYNSGQHLLNLINDILDHAKIVADKMEIKADYFDIKAVVDGVRSIGIGLVKDKPIDIKVDMESGLPQVYGDEIRTRQVLLNLLSNATKFTSQGAITLSAYRDQHSKTGAPMIRVDVSDTGIGIAEKDLPLLFEAFRQVDSSLTRTVGGTGLGLPISKSLVELQGGEMLVESEVNRGSTFSVTIPIEPPEIEPEDQEEDSEMEFAPVNSAALQNTPSGNGSNGHSTQDIRKTISFAPPPKRQILVIEDNPDRVDQFRRILQRQGFDVFAASIPLEAEAMAGGLHPSVIVMDVNFADGAGWHILDKIKGRDDTFDIPIIVVTLSNERERVVEAGAFAFLQHPIVPEDLVGRVLDAERESNRDRILIIDDQAESRRLLTEMLDEQGHYRVFSADNGSEGVALVARRRPDLVILDLRMPEMDGFAVLDELRSNPETAPIPVLVVTADALDADEQAQLDGISVLHKTDLSTENSQAFLVDVKKRLSRSGE